MIAAVGALLLAAALAVRVLFWRATPDTAWPYSALFKGDAPLWLEYAQALRSGRPFELGLPIHPPGMGYLLAWLWNGEPGGIAFLRLCWAVLGALGVGLVGLAALRSFGVFVAAAVGVICCFSSGLLLLSSSLDSETPYLVLVLATLALFEDIRAQPHGAALAAWAALHGLACLFRVEHSLYFGLMLAWLAVLWSREAPGGAADRRARAGRAVALSLAFFLLPLLPWHLTAWRAIARFNTEEPARGAAEEAAVRAIERGVATLRWDVGAERRRDELPAFCRRTSAAFVAATVAWRGGQEVRDGDFRILEEAFGYVPQPVSRFPFVSCYGPLNFALANHPAARGGFDRRALEEPPPLAGGADRYPPMLVQGLPPPRLSFDYPPHVRLFNDGYAVGWRRIREDAAGFLELARRKLRIFWSGAALGFTGYGLPLGLAGVRRAVDLTTPEGGAADLWRAGWLVACAAGVAAGCSRLALRAWLLFAASKAAVAVLFFGYARQGATIVPVVALLLAVSAETWLLPRLPRLSPRQAACLVAVLVLVGVGVESVRWARPPVIRVDGLVAGPVDPFPPDLHRDHRIDVGGPDAQTAP